MIQCTPLVLIQKIKGDLKISSKATGYPQQLNPPGSMVRTIVCACVFSPYYLDGAYDSSTNPNLREVFL